MKAVYFSFFAAAITVLFAASPASAQNVAAKPAAEAGTSPSAQNWTLSRTPWGDPDFQGYWTNTTDIPIERPKELGSKEFYTPEEFAQKRKAEEAAASKRLEGRQTEPGTQADVHYDLAQYGLDRSQSKIATSLRTSLVTGPTGRIPPMLPEAQKRNAERTAYQRAHQWDGPEGRPLAERCILWPNEGPPMMPVGYNGNLEIAQSPGYIAITQEMIHDTRIIPIGTNHPHLPPSVHQWMGDSRGHWEGNTLVVETTNFTDKTAFRGSTADLKVIERFTRTGPDSIKYEFTVSDPKTWDQPWSAEIPMSKIAGPIYEYACQEGNYGMANNLSGARAAEKKAAEGK
ncbi:MAG TPA: hypothetical protein VKV17_18435 [Bryobacteraceae bacterium]|nr:hypothetical protein [Bryobacteraceae bacterium]